LRGKSARNKTKIAKKLRLNVRLNATNVDESGSRNERREKKKEIANERSVIASETCVKSADVNVTQMIERRIGIVIVIGLGLVMACVQIGGCCPRQQTAGRRSRPRLTAQFDPFAEAGGTTDAENRRPTELEREAA
jgi:hypothetical protein